MIQARHSAAGSYVIRRVVVQKTVVQKIAVQKIVVQKIAFGIPVLGAMCHMAWMLRVERSRNRLELQIELPEPPKGLAVELMMEQVMELPLRVA